jgi:lysophospholipid acyltransferase (LPLAT)-like uncharacterized protein
LAGLIRETTVKIRNRFLVRTAGFTLARTARLLVKSLAGGYRPLGPNLDPAHLVGGTDRYIYSIWHENLLIPAAGFGHPDLAVLVSKHADGQLLAAIARYMGMTIVAGSTRRGGVDALRRLVDGQAPWRHLAVTPDGPRGPRRVLQPGILFVAAKTGMKIVPCGIACSRVWRLKSWDRFAVPKPFARALELTAEPIAIPLTVGPNDLEPYRFQVQGEMDRLQAIADYWAVTGVLDRSITSHQTARLAA